MLSSELCSQCMILHDPWMCDLFFLPSLNLWTYLYLVIIGMVFSTGYSLQVLVCLNNKSKVYL